MAAPNAITGLGVGATDAGGAWTYTCGAPGSGGAGTVVILQILQDGATNGAVTVSSGTNIENLVGTDNVWTQIPGPNADGSFPVGASSEARQHLYIGRQLSASAPTAAGGNSTSEDLYIRSYPFNNVNTGTTLANVIENGSAGATANGVGTSATASDTGVTTLDVDRLVLQFIAVNDDLVIPAFTGETGGDWGINGASYADAGGTDGAICCQISTAPTATTINGGTGSLGISGAWGVVGFALIGTTAGAPVTLNTNFMRRRRGKIRQGVYIA